MTDKTERDALVARLRGEADRKECVPTRTPTLNPASRWLHPAELRTLLAQAAEALAAPAEGGQGEAVVNLSTLQRWHAALDGYHPSDVPDTVAAREEMAALIDSAGGAKGITGSVSSQMRDANACTPQPAEGDGAVADALMVVNDAANDARHAGDYAKANALVRARVTLYRASTRPAATAVAVAQVRRGGRAGPHDALYAGLIPRGPATPEVKEGDLLYLRPSASVDVEELRKIADGIDPRIGTMGCAETARRIRDMIDSAGGAKGDRLTDCGHSKYEPCHNCEPAEGDGAVLAEAARYHYAQADNPRDQFGNTSNHKNPKLEAWHRQIGDEITEAITRPAATAQVPASWDTKALDVARLFTHASETQRRARLQCAVLEAMQWAAAPAAPKGGVVVTDEMVEGVIERVGRENSIDGMDGDTWDRLLVRAALATGEQP